MVGIWWTFIYTIALLLIGKSQANVVEHLYLVATHEHCSSKDKENKYFLQINKACRDGIP